MATLIIFDKINRKQGINLEIPDGMAKFAIPKLIASSLVAME